MNVQVHLCCVDLYGFEINLTMKCTYTSKIEAFATAIKLFEWQKVF